jgi:hypothetical protein
MDLAVLGGDWVVWLREWSLLSEAGREWNGAVVLGAMLFGRSLFGASGDLEV